MKIPRIIAGWGVTAAAVLAVATPLASAAPVVKIVNTNSGVSCVFETAEGDLVFFTASASTLSGDSGSDMFVETPDGQPVLFGDGGTAEFGADGSFSAEVPLQDADTGQAVGTASLQATRTQFGEPVAEEVSDRGNGNTWTRGTTTTTDYRISLQSVSVPGYTVLANDDDCTSENIVFDVKSNDPSSQIYRSTSFRSAICPLDGLPGGAIRLSGQLRTPYFEVVIDDGVNPLEASGDVVLTAGSGEVTRPLINLVTEQKVADLTIEIDLSKLGRRNHEAVSLDGVTERVAWVPYQAVITITTTDGRSGTAECYAEYVTDHIIIRPTAGSAE